MENYEIEESLSYPVVNGHCVRILPEEDVIKRQEDGTERHGEHVQDDSKDSESIIPLYHHASLNSEYLVKST